MNPVQNFFKDIPDNKLRQAILEIIEDDVKHFIRMDGLVREYNERVTLLTKRTSVDLFLTIIDIYKEAAHRWAKQN